MYKVYKLYVQYMCKLKKTKTVIMKIYRKDPITGKTKCKDLPICQEQLKMWQRTNIAIQHVMPNLSANDREFLINGIDPKDHPEIYEADDVT